MWITYVKQYQQHHGIKTWKQALMEAKPHYWVAKNAALRNGVTSWVPFVPSKAGGVASQPVAPTPVHDAFDPNTTTKIQQLPEPVNAPLPKKKFVSQIPKPKIFYTKVSHAPQVFTPHMKCAVRYPIKIQQPIIIQPT